MSHPIVGRANHAVIGVGTISSVDNVINSVQSRTINMGMAANSNHLVKAIEQNHIRYKSSPQQDQQLPNSRQHLMHEIRKNSRLN